MNGGDSAFQEFVKSALIYLKYEIKTLSYSIDVIKSMLHSSESSRMSTEFENDCDDLQWPISNHEQLENIENSLKDAKIKNNETVKLSKLVGMSVSESVRRMMSKMFDDQFLKQFSFIGFKGKNKFSGLHCCQLLFDAIRKDKKFDFIPDKEISVITARWMAQATNRINKKS